ncbi:alanine racemase [Bacillus canaveralius]|uniref:Alanine racemase n=1 Tax=Bacillus canaveralius TaxID=1403243 RepID=A0A2N5GRX8_9BACI|nr:alanine racemase [Bacillus canaveralius]PLR86293.1 alanine racemase [Bacillus canaveralius]PLR97772.1 alanine racemase [Bacillus canaveralius]
MEYQGSFYRDTWVEIDLNHIEDNLKSIKKLLPNEVEMIAVVKANAYGHGDIQTAEAALRAGASMLAVAFMDEAIALRRKGITAPILVLGASRPEDINVAAELNLTLTVFQEEWIVKAAGILKPELEISVHIKVDTGMNRIGVGTRDELRKLEASITNNRQIRMEGIYTHFATADELDLSYSGEQLERFNDLLGVLDNLPRYIHSSNSAAAIRFPEAHFNAVRVGIAMYGLTPSLEIAAQLPIALKEAFSLHSRLVHVKKINKGEKVSYGATYEAAEDEWIGTLPIGYADGWIRKLQGQDVLVEGRRVPIVGRICMDQCMVKLPSYVPVGTNCTLIGSQKAETISINEIASKLETINYEIPCMISNRVPRIFKQNGKMLAINNPLLT